MKRLIFRVVAFVIDLFILNIILFAISNISFINHNKELIQDTVFDFNNVRTQYNELSPKLDNILYDNHIDMTEGLEFKSNYPYFYNEIYYIPINEELTEEQVNDVKYRVENGYKQAIYQYNYNISRYDMTINIIGVVISILYFGVLEWYMKGKTIGKKLLRLKTVDNSNNKASIPLWKYLVKAVLVSGVIFTTADIILSLLSCGTNECSRSLEWFNNSYSLVYNIQYVYNTLFMLFIFIRSDERSIHDVLLNIRVALFDKNGKEVDSRIFNENAINKAN